MYPSFIHSFHLFSFYNTGVFFFVVRQVKLLHKISLVSISLVLFRVPKKHIFFLKTYWPLVCFYTSVCLHACPFKYAL
jgi:hypothetical protein